jgi:hypothetical protein
MEPSSYFELTIAGRSPEAPEVVRVESPEGLEAHLARYEVEPLWAVGLGYVEDEADRGSFWLLVRGDRAFIHLMEGPCLSARDPAAIGGEDGTVAFRDDGGNWHEVPPKATVSREQGLRALRHWMTSGEKLPDLDWRPA